MHIIVLCTVKDKTEAKAIAQNLVELQLAACVNILDGVNSIYNWGGKMCDDTEALMVIKTKKALFDRLEKAIKEQHSYDNPEIIAFLIERGSHDYLSWIDQSTV